LIQLTIYYINIFLKNCYFN